MGLLYKRANLEEKEANQLKRRAQGLECIKSLEKSLNQNGIVALTSHIYRRKLTDKVVESSGENNRY